MVTTATASLLQLALLSAITTVKPFTGIPNKMKESSMENCPRYNDFSNWFDLQNAAAGSLLKHNDHLKEALGNSEGTKAKTNCCFKDKDLMQLVIDNVNKIQQQNGNNEKKTLSPSGELQKDLNQIIVRIKELVARGFKSCCLKMEESLNKMKKDFEKPFENVKEKFKSDSSDDFSKDFKKLKEKHKSLSDQIKDTNERLDKLESNKDSQSRSQSSCCTELDAKIEVLNKEMNAARAEVVGKTNQFESQLKDIENMFEAQQNRAKDLKNTLDTQGEAVNKDLESCVKYIQQLPNTTYNINNSSALCMGKLLARVGELESRVSSFINKQTELGNNIHINMKTCLENDKKVDIIKERQSRIIGRSLQMKEHGNEKQKDRIKALEKEVDELRQSANKSQTYCENIGNLNAFAENLQNHTDRMKQIYADHKQQNEMALKELKKQLNNILTKLKNIQNNAIDIQILKNLQEMLQKAKIDFKVIEGEVNGQEKSGKQAADLKKMAQETDQFWLQVDGRLSHLESRASYRSNHGDVNPWDNLEKLYNDLRQALDGTNINLEGSQKLQKLYNLELEWLKKLEHQVAKCLKGCKEVAKMYALIKTVTGIIKVISPKKTTVARSSKPKVQKSTNMVKKG